MRVIQRHCRRNPIREMPEEMGPTRVESGEGVRNLQSDGDPTAESTQFILLSCTNLEASASVDAKATAPLILRSITCFDGAIRSTHNVISCQVNLEDGEKILLDMSH
ncbi:hypothetical protein BHE74_00034422 [Ensete ventricosum]|nr:hypothetical protein BHE74_00034422 [Ensete ventricosum]